jgi:hypothetical protein
MWEDIFNAAERTDQRNVRIRLEATRKARKPNCTVSFTTSTGSCLADSPSHWPSKKTTSKKRVFSPEGDEPFPIAAPKTHRSSPLTGTEHSSFRPGLGPVHERRSRTLNLLRNGISNSDEMRREISRQEKLIRKTATGRWNGTPSAAASLTFVTGVVVFFHLLMFAGFDLSGWTISIWPHRPGRPDAAIN